MNIQNLLNLVQEDIYRCLYSDCDVVLNGKEAFTQHLEKKHPQKPSLHFKCSICLQGFKHKKLLLTHTNNKHFPNVASATIKTDTIVKAAICKEDTTEDSHRSSISFTHEVNDPVPKDFFDNL